MPKSTCPSPRAQVCVSKSACRSLPWRLLRSVRPGHCASLIYTSGTTGNPKAVMISHDNVIFQSIATCDMLFFSGRLTPGALGLEPMPTLGCAPSSSRCEVPRSTHATFSRVCSGALPTELRILSYLPLSHIAAQMVDLCSPIILVPRSRPRTPRRPLLRLLASSPWPRGGALTWPRACRRAVLGSLLHADGAARRRRAELLRPHLLHHVVRSAGRDEGHPQELAGRLPAVGLPRCATCLGEDP